MQECYPRYGELMQTTLRKAMAFCAVTATLLAAAPSKTDSTNPSRLAALTEFFTQMPKGGDIHHHYSGAMYAETDPSPF